MKITAIYHYPIKSCGAVALDAAELDDSGVLDDRRLMLVAPDGTFLSQARQPRLALVRPSIQGNVLDVIASGMEPLALAIDENGNEQSAEFWFDQIDVVDQGVQAADWFSRFLDTECRLVSTQAAFDRSPPAEGALTNRQRRFTDAGNIHITAESSLADLNGRLSTPVPMNRFRPNIVVDGEDAFAEDSWKRLQIGDVSLNATITCERCSIVATTQETAQRGKEPLKTLAGYRKFQGGFGSGVLFGIHLDVSTCGRIRVGDSVEVLERGQLLGANANREFNQ
jgi:uncharacterized protein YcbX